MAVFILQTHYTSRRTWARKFSASFNASLFSSRIKTGIRRIRRPVELYGLMRVEGRTKPFSSSGRIMRLSI